jgi:hypothetical protein
LKSAIQQVGNLRYESAARFGALVHTILQAARPPSAHSGF